jgi:hypothetical protein
MQCPSCRTENAPAARAAGIRAGLGEAAAAPPLPLDPSPATGVAEA